MPPEARVRRNGQPQACEPCRKTKVRCDHGSPRCSRCVLRRLDCIYHPAPMTKHRDYLNSPPPVHGFTAMNSTHHVPLSPITTPTEQHHLNVTSSGSMTSGTASPSLSGTESSYEKAKRNSLFQKEGMPYGTTRFSAVFSENQASFGPAISDVEDDAGLRVSSSGSDQPSGGVDVSTFRRELAIKTMLGFPTLRTCELLLENTPEMYDVWLSPTMIRQCLAQVWTDYGGCLGNNRSRESVSVMVDDIFENGKQPLPTPDPRHDAAWINWFGGPRLRWEMIGILFTWAGMIFRHKQEWDHIFELPEQQNRNRKTAAEKMRECASNCLRLCEDFAEINDIIVVLMKNNGKLHSNIISDESDHCRVDFGTTGAAFITAGLHRLPISQEVTPLSQHKSIIASSFFQLDKSESLFTGRPPILDKRYCYIPLPLDLCEDDVYNGQERLTAAVKRLDSQGWSKDNQVYATTWLRAVSLLAPISEEILLLSLNAHVQYTKSQVETLVVQLEQVVNSYPAHIRYHTIQNQSSSSSRKRPPHEIYMITRIQLEVLKCAFLAQRLLVSRGFSNGQNLFNVAQELISVVLSFWSDREHLRDYNFSFDWIILSYGIPCAGILCLELLRASNLAPPMPATESMPSPTPVQLSRSEVVQTLTMFIAFLNWIRPTDNNVQLCSKFKKVVKRIIDTAIDAPRPTYTPSIQSQQPKNQQEDQASGQFQTPAHNQFLPQSAQHPDSLVGTDFMNEFDPAIMAMDDLDWLNTVDWTQGDWLELSQQNFLP